MNDCGGLLQAHPSQLARWAKANRVPLNVTFELTPFCNFRCVMCYVRLEPEQAAAQGQLLEPAQWLEIAHQARKMGTLNLTLTGGEPLTHPHFWEIYEKLNQMGFLITVLSNGYLIDEVVMEKFRRFGMPYAMKLTLYGASDETYLRTCGRADGFTRVSAAIELLQQAKIPLQLSATIVRENAADLQEMYRFARQRSLPFQHTMTVSRSSRGAVNSVETSRFSYEEFLHELTLEELEKSKFPPLESPFAWCLSYGCALWVTWNGRLQSCTFLTDPAVQWSGNLEKDWAELLSATDALKSPAECAQCRWSPFCQRCPGLLCAESGHPEKIDSGLCHTAKCLFHRYEQWRDES
ncbi:MAG: radical SAM protein [Ruminococcaceae bacterium]|nr:radical SAM protein [Oscillospiraceae bacterium]